MNLKLAGFAIIVAAFVVPVEVQRSLDKFDHEAALTGSVTLMEFEFTTPHCWLHVSVVDPNTGRMLDWAFEMGSVGQIATQGLKADTVKPGDKITIEAHPMKDGSRGGQSMSANLSDGRTFTHAPNANPNAAR